MDTSPFKSVYLDFVQGMLVSLVRQKGMDLTARQMGVLLVCYSEPEPQTVRDLAARLRVRKPVITRAIRRLEELQLLDRKHDPVNGRSILTQRTETGAAFLHELQQHIATYVEGRQLSLTVGKPAGKRTDADSVAHEEQ